MTVKNLGPGANRAGADAVYSCAGGRSLVPEKGMPASDEQLLRAFVAGSEASLGELAQRYEGALVGLARGLLWGRDDLARDAVQDAWVRVIRGARHFDARSRVKTWLYRIVVNRCSDLRERWGDRMKGQAPEGELPAPGGPGEWDSESVARLRVALEGLAPGQRVTVLMCYHAGLTHAEVAEALGVPLGTVKSRLHAALDALRGKLQEEGAR